MKSKDINIKCVVCNKALKHMYEGDYSPETDMWHDACVHDIVPGYGS